MYNELIKPRSFIATNGYIFNSQETVQENIEKIKAGEPVSIITVTDERTGYKDIVKTQLHVFGDYSIGSKDDSDIEILEDGKAVAEANAEKYRQEVEEAEAKAKAEQEAKANEAIDSIDVSVDGEVVQSVEVEAVEEVQQETL